MKVLEKNTMGLGNRLCLPGIAVAQFRALQMAQQRGETVGIVSNQSNRELIKLGNGPLDVVFNTQKAARVVDWKLPVHIDADHIGFDPDLVGFDTVDWFLPHSDFFTLDVAKFINQPAAPEAIDAFVSRHQELTRKLEISGLSASLEVTPAEVKRIAEKYLFAVQQAGKIYRHIAEKKGAENVIIEISMDETDSPQTPLEMLIILAMIADEKIPIQTIAPKFTGFFPKGDDYEGELGQFEREYNDDLAVIRFAIKTFGLPENLKISLHSGSDKLTLYPIINRAMKAFNTGVHIKTSGTTWLELVRGLAKAGGEGLKIAREICVAGINNREAFCLPYGFVSHIDPDKLPSVAEVNGVDGETLAVWLKHDPLNTFYRPHFRRLAHLAFQAVPWIKGGASRFLFAVEDNMGVIGPEVTGNLFDNHIKPIFLGEE